MKSFLFIVILASNPAFAGTDSGAEELDVTYVSWCQGSKVMGQFENQEAYVKFDCHDTKKVCKETPLFRMGRMVILASCTK